MAYYRSTPSSDSSEWQSSSSSSSYARHVSINSIASSSRNSDTESVLISYISPLTIPTPPLSPPSPSSSITRSPHVGTLRPASISSGHAIRIDLDPSVTISFVHAQRQFKLRYTHIDILRSTSGELKGIELNDYSRAQGSLLHQFPSAKQAVPHLEQPTESEKASLRVSFFGTQTIQTAQTFFQADPCYTFANERDCIRFQETLLQQQVVMIAGVAEIKSKGRGEECISQNLRMLRAPTGGFNAIYFANSQRREKKRYVLIPMNAVDRIEPGKKGSKAISVRLRPNSDLLKEMKTVQFKFLEESDYRTFYGVLCQVVGLHAEG